MKPNNLLHINDLQGQYPVSYYAATRWDGLPMCSELIDRQNTEIAIIGAGYTGLSSAIHLRRLGYEVTVLDAQRIGFGASGRNGGQVGMGQRLDQVTLEKKVGKEIAQLFWNLSVEGKRLVESLMRESGVDCDLQRGILCADHRARFSAESKAYVDKLRNEYRCEEISFFNREQTVHAVGSDAYYSGIYDASARHLHPLNFCLGLAKIALQLGVRIHEQSEVLSVEQTAQAVLLKTASGSLGCETLLYACNGYIGELAPLMLKQQVMPINNYIIATEPLEDTLFDDILKNNIAAADSKFVVNYFRKSADKRLLFGGRESYSYRFHSDIKNYVRRAMCEIYPQLQATKIDYGWGGTLAITMSRMPYFKQLSQNQYAVSGYSGHGVSTATLAGKLVAHHLHETKMGRAKSNAGKAFEVFANYPQQAFPGRGHLKNVWLVLGMMYYALRDKL